MPRWPLYILLPVLGALAAFFAFATAAPYVDTLVHRTISPTDPAFNYTTGTTWDTVNHVVFGSALLGSFAFVIKVRTAGWKRGLLSGLSAAVSGAVLIPLANGLGDNVGIHADRAAFTQTERLALILWLESWLGAHWCQAHAPFSWLVASDSRLSD